MISVEDGKVEANVKKIYINGLFTSQRLTGVHRFATELVLELDKNVKNDMVVLVCPANTDIKLWKFSNIKVVQLKHSTGRIFEQIFFPIYVSSKKGIALTLSSLCPVIFPGYWVIHDVLFREYPMAFNWRFRAVYDLVCKLCLKRCKKIITVSKTSAKALSRIYNISQDKIAIVYNSIGYILNEFEDTNTLNKYHLEAGKYILNVGSNNLIKNRDFLYKVAQANRDLQFVIVGGVHKTFANTKNEDLSNVIHCDYILDKELVSLYKNAGAFIYPSLKEGFGIPPLEAICFGCSTVFLSDIEIFHEIYPKGVNFINIYETENLRLNLKEAQEISKEERQWYFNQYSVKNNVKRMLEIIEVK